MIEINLLPHELKAKSKNAGLEPGYFLYLIPLVFALLVCAHIILAVVTIARSYQFIALNNKLKSLEPQRKIFENLNKENGMPLADAKLIQQLTVQRINWPEKLNKLSLNLPPGVWFEEITVSSKSFILKGSVISLQKEEMALINKFMDNLKNDTSFFKDFNNLGLSSVQRRVIGGYEIIDFTLLGNLKAK